MEILKLLKKPRVTVKDIEEALITPPSSIDADASTPTPAEALMALGEGLADNLKQRQQIQRSEEIIQQQGETITRYEGLLRDVLSLIRESQVNREEWERTREASAHALNEMTQRLSVVTAYLDRLQHNAELEEAMMVTLKEKLEESPT